MTKEKRKNRKKRTSHNNHTAVKKSKKRRSQGSKKKKAQKEVKVKIFKELKMLTTAFAICLTIIAISIFLTTTFGKMTGYSMLPTVNNNDVFSINKVTSIKNFDVVYLKVPKKNGEKTVRRVIGIPGDELSYKNDELSINTIGKSERYLNNRKNDLLGGILTEDFTLKSLTGQSKVPKDHYFVMGDNRQSSADSRDYGFVHKKDIVGKVEVVLFPLSNLKNIR